MDGRTDEQSVFTVKRILDTERKQSLTEACSVAVNGLLQGEQLSLVFYFEADRQS
jgi:hypothetical protein